MNDLNPQDVNERGESYQDLERALREQLRRQPDLALARVMLLELYFKMGRRSAFFNEAKKLYRFVPDPESSLEWQRCASLGRLLDPTNELYRRGSSELLDAAQAATAASAARKMRRLGENPLHEALFRELAATYEETIKDRRFLAALDVELLHSASRPTSLLHLRNLSQHLGGAAIYLKREDLAPPATHLTMMVMGQVLLARQLGCKSIVTSTVNGRRGLVAAATAARFDLHCVVYMDAKDTQRNLRNVFRMSLMGADLQSVDVTALPNQDVREVALEHWASHPKQSFMVTGLDAVPAPYPSMQRAFTSAIGRECRRQVLAAARRLPDVLVARGRPAADAFSFLPPLLADTGTRLVCVEPADPAAGAPVEEEPADAAPLTEQERRQAPEIIEGMDYPGVEREHSFLKATGRVEYLTVGDEQIHATVSKVAKLEGLIPSLGMARPLAWACAEAKRRDPAQAIVVMYSESGEKELAQLARFFGMSLELPSAI